MSKCQQLQPQQTYQAKIKYEHPRFIVERQSDEPEFTRVQCSDYVQVVLEDEPASAVSLSAGPIVPGKWFIFETKPTSRLGQE